MIDKRLLRLLDIFCESESDSTIKFFYEEYKENGNKKKNARNTVFNPGFKENVVSVRLFYAVNIVKHLPYVVKTRAVAENRFISDHIKNAVPDSFSCVDGNVLAAQKSEKAFDRTACKNHNNSA